MSGKTIKQAVYDILDSMDDRSVVGGWELYDKVRAVTGRNTYPSTILGYCRDYCDITGGEFICLDNQKSKYMLIKGSITLGGFMPNGKE